MEFKRKELQIGPWDDTGNQGNFSFYRNLLQQSDICEAGYKAEVDQKYWEDKPRNQNDKTEVKFNTRDKVKQGLKSLKSLPVQQCTQLTETSEPATFLQYLSSALANRNPMQQQHQTQTNGTLHEESNLNLRFQCASPTNIQRNGRQMFNDLKRPLESVNGEDPENSKKNEGNTDDSHNEEFCNQNSTISEFTPPKKKTQEDDIHTNRFDDTLMMKSGLLRQKQSPNFEIERIRKTQNLSPIYPTLDCQHLHPAFKKQKTETSEFITNNGFSPRENTHLKNQNNQLLLRNNIRKQVLIQKENIAKHFKREGMFPLQQQEISNSNSEASQTAYSFQSKIMSGGTTTFNTNATSTPPSTSSFQPSSKRHSQNFNHNCDNELVSELLLGLGEPQKTNFSEEDLELKQIFVPEKQPNQKSQNIKLLPELQLKCGVVSLNSPCQDQMQRLNPYSTGIRSKSNNKNIEKPGLTNTLITQSRETGVFEQVKYFSNTLAIKTQAQNENTMAAEKSIFDINRDLVGRMGAPYGTQVIGKLQFDQENVFSLSDNQYQERLKADTTNKQKTDQCAFSIQQFLHTDMKFSTALQSIDRKNYNPIRQEMLEFQIKSPLPVEYFSSKN